MAEQMGNFRNLRLKASSLIKPPPNNSMDVRAKQRLCYRTGLFNSELRVAGFAPRHLSRCALRGETNEQIWKQLKLTSPTKMEQS